MITISTEESLRLIVKMIFQMKKLGLSQEQVTAALWNVLNKD